MVVCDALLAEDAAQILMAELVVLAAALPVAPVVDGELRRERELPPPPICRARDAPDVHRLAECVADLAQRHRLQKLLPVEDGCSRQLDLRTLRRPGESGTRPAQRIRPARADERLLENAFLKCFPRGAGLVAQELFQLRAAPGFEVANHAAFHALARKRLFVRAGLAKHGAGVIRVCRAKFVVLNQADGRRELVRDLLPLLTLPCVAEFVDRVRECGESANLVCARGVETKDAIIRDHVAVVLFGVAEDADADNAVEVVQDDALLDSESTQRALLNGRLVRVADADLVRWQMLKRGESALGLREDDEEIAVNVERHGVIEQARLKIPLVTAHVAHAEPLLSEPALRFLCPFGILARVVRFPRAPDGVLCHLVDCALHQAVIGVESARVADNGAPVLERDVRLRVAHTRVPVWALVRVLLRRVQKFG